MLVFKMLTLTEERRFRLQTEKQFGRGCARAQAARYQLLVIEESAVQDFHRVPHARDLLVSSAQTHFLLMLYTLPQPQDRFEGKTKSHDLQLGKARSRETLSANETVSPGFCMRKRCNSGMRATALSSVESLPFW